MESAEQLLVETGAAAIPHPGGTLLEHLRRVRWLLASWGASLDIQLAGLTHAAYGTDGFTVSLLDLTERPRLAHAIGDAAEGLVYLYGSCDRTRTYPRLGQELVTVDDRFTGRATRPDIHLLRAFVEITAANELDVIQHNPTINAQQGQALQALFARARRHLSPAATLALDERPCPDGRGRAVADDASERHHFGLSGRFRGRLLSDRTSNPPSLLRFWVV